MYGIGRKSPRTGDLGSLQRSWTVRQISRLLIGLLAIPLGGTGFAQQTSSPPPRTAAEHRAPAPGREVASTSQLPVDFSGDATPDAPLPQSTGASTQQQSSSQQQSTSQQPLGTAAAPYEQPSGITASRPAGAAIAPAKQRRTRTFIIRVGVLVAAGVALGTVIALSSASPSTPH